MANEPLQEDAQDEEVEHIEADVQQVGMQEDGCYKAPVLSHQYQAVDFRSIFREDVGEDVVVLDVDGVGQHVRDDAANTMCSRVQRYVGGGETPDSAGADHYDPGDPGDACQSSTTSVMIECSCIAFPD